MKKILPFICSICMLTSCATMHVISTKAVSNDIENNGRYVYGNEVIGVAYDMWTKGGRFNFAIKNKLTSPLLINWKRSALIIDGISYTYRSQNDDSISFIPPNASILCKANKYLISDTPSTYDIRKKFRNYITYYDGKESRYIDNIFEITEIKKIKQVNRIRHTKPTNFFTKK